MLIIGLIQSNFLKAKPINEYENEIDCSCFCRRGDLPYVYLIQYGGGSDEYRRVCARRTYHTGAPAGNPEESAARHVRLRCGTANYSGRSRQKVSGAEGEISNGRQRSS